MLISSRSTEHASLGSLSVLCQGQTQGLTEGTSGMKLLLGPCESSQSHALPLTSASCLPLCRRATAVCAQTGADGHQGPGASPRRGGPAAIRECSGEHWAACWLHACYQQDWGIVAGYWDKYACPMLGEMSSAERLLRRMHSASPRRQFLAPLTQSDHPRHASCQISFC